MDQTITIKLLHERRSSNASRKIDGKSGMLYLFRWDPAHKAYCYTTEKQVEVDDIFHSQGRSLACYFAPVFHREKAKPLSDDLTLALLQRDLMLPDCPVGADAERIALAMLAAYDKGHEFARAKWAPLATLAEVAAPAEPQIVTSTTGAVPETVGEGIAMVENVAAEMNAQFPPEATPAPAPAAAAPAVENPAPEPVEAPKAKPGKSAKSAKAGSQATPEKASKAPGV
jgi:hypothetical protein